MTKSVDFTTLLCYNILMQAPVYSTAEVAELTGFTVRQLNYWAVRGIVVPSVHQAHGKGSRKLYAWEDLIQFRYIQHLTNAGWSTQKIRGTINTLREVMGDSDPLKRAILFPAKNTILALCRTQAGERILLDAIKPGGQQVMLIVLEMLVAEVIAATQHPARELVLVEAN